MIQKVPLSSEGRLAEPAADDGGVGRAGERALLAISNLELPDHHDERRYNTAALDALAASILRWGQLQPVVVRRVADRYEIVCGGRRWLAIKRAGLANVWVEECTATDIESLAMRLADNLHHVGLSHAERVAALDQLSELVGAGGLRATARLIGADPGWLSRQLGIRADPVLFPALEAGQIGFGQASELRRAPGEQRARLLQRVLDAGGRVATATIRAWVVEARSRPQPASEMRQPGTSDVGERVTGLSALVEQLRRLGTPQDETERAMLQELASTAQSLLSKPHAEAATPTAPESMIKVSHTEVSCLLCGELTGLRDQSGVLRVTSPAGVTRRGRQLTCGRCGGALTGGSIRVEYHRSGSAR